MTKIRYLQFATACLLTVIGSAAADEASLAERVAELEAAAKGPGLLQRMAEHDVIISGSGAVAFFSGDARSGFSEDAFRVDEARLFIDARLMPNAFFFSELVIQERQTDQTQVGVGELYIDWENPLARHLGKDRLNLRFGHTHVALALGELLQIGIEIG